jgi:hypothetical protein
VEFPPASLKPAVAGPSALVASLIGHLPGPAVSAPTATWHQAFFTLRERYGAALPGLRALHFYQRPGLPSVSGELEDILQTMTLLGLAIPLRSQLLFRPQDQERLHLLTSDSLFDQPQLLQQVASDLAVLLASHA